MDGRGDEATSSSMVKDCDSPSIGNEVVGDNHSASFDVTLNIVDVVSSIDEQSRPDLDSLGGSSSFPEIITGSPDNYHTHLDQQQLDQRHHSKDQTYPYFRARDEESQEYTTGSRQRSSTTTSGTPPLQSTPTNPKPAPPAVLSASSRAAIIIRHFRLVILSNIFFVLGSALFLSASLEEYQEETNGPSVKAESDVVDDTTESMVPSTAPVPEGYHLQLSTSIDTYVTEQMLLMIGATFCFLQVGIINFVRTPLDKFHFFQILAGIFGLVSAMLWETKDILSTLAYFFFVHAMMGQSLLQLHSHYWKMLAPSWVARRDLQSQKSETESSKHIQVRPFQGPVPHDQVDPGNMHVANDDISFSIGNSFSLEEPKYPPPTSDTDLSYAGDMTEDDRRLSSPYDTNNMGTATAEQIMIQQGIQLTSLRDDHNGRDDDDVTFQYGIVFCVADGFFVFGSTVELVLTYWDLFLLTNSDDDDNSIDHTGPDPSVHLLSGIFWSIFAIIALVATVLLQRYRFDVPPMEQ